MATLQRSHLRQNGNSGDNRHLEGDIEHNPDIIPGMNHHHHHHLNVQCAESESLRSGTPVKSDISGGGSVSGYGTGADSTGSDKTPPYLPKSKVICNPMDHHHVTYAQLAFPPHSNPNLPPCTPRYAVND